MRGKQISGQNSDWGYAENENDYVNKQVVVMGGNFSQSDLVIDLYQIVKGALYLL